MAHAWRCGYSGATLARSAGRYPTSSWLTTCLIRPPFAPHPFQRRLSHRALTCTKISSPIRYLPTARPDRCHQHGERDLITSLLTTLPCSPPTNLVQFAFITKAGLIALLAFTSLSRNTMNWKLANAAASGAHHASWCRLAAVEPESRKRISRTIDSVEPALGIRQNPRAFFDLLDKLRQGRSAVSRGAVR